jgi:hypothetical protein
MLYIHYKLVVLSLNEEALVSFFILLILYGWSCNSEKKNERESQATVVQFPERLLDESVPTLPPVYLLIHTGYPYYVLYTALLISSMF